MRDVIFLMMTLAGSLVGFARPTVGCLLFVFFGFFSPQSFTWGFGREFPASQLLALATLGGALLSKELRHYRFQGEIAILGLLWFLFLNSTIFALAPVVAWERFVDVSKILLMVIVTTILVNRPDSLRWLMRIIGLSIGFYGLKGGWFAIASGGGFLVYGPELSFLNANNSIGLAMAVNLPILYFLYNTESNRWLRRLCLVMLMFSYPAIVCTYSRGAWLGLGVASTLMVLKSQNRFFIIPTAAVLAVALALIVPVIAPERLSQRYDTLVNYEKDPSAVSRFWNWESCRRVGVSRPFTGGGFSYYHRSVTSEYYPEFAARWPGKTWSCHNAALTVLAEHGVFAFVLWLALFGFSFMNLKRLRAYGRADPGRSELVLYAAMLQTSMITYFVVGMFLDAAYFDMIYYLVGVIVVLKTIHFGAVQNTQSLAYRHQAARPAAQILAH